MSTKNPAERRDLINTYIQTKGEAMLAELEELCPSVSSMTVRRDLEQLERLGQIVRIRGGARSLSQLSVLKEAAYNHRQLTNMPAKYAIADKAATLVNSGSSIYIDSGTTCMCFAQRLPDQNLFVLSPAPNIALELVKNVNIKINLTGGQLNRDTLTLSGVNALEYAKTLNIETAFMGASAFSLSSGFSCGDYYEAELKRLITRRAHHVVVLMDSTKLDGSMPYTFARLRDINAFVTDSPLPEKYMKAMRQAQVAVH
ncbi:MAG: DeoR/GlpR transcriptional regulator [Lentisphaerae bacterium]|jgi:DeoR family fructose operon transcriptional repressor|nr:DeoR/GlpR transcriptional regulator [Lentisphaerota bacterium]